MGDLPLPTLSIHPKPPLHGSKALLNVVSKALKRIISQDPSCSKGNRF